MKIVVAGAGFVGLSNAILLALKHEVVVYDIDPRRVSSLNAKVTTVRDPLAEVMLPTSTLTASGDPAVFADADCVFIATPTDYNEQTSYFNTDSVTSVLDTINDTCLVVIRSTLPVGYVNSVAPKYPNQIVFCPEFLREGSAMSDTMNPTRLVVGDKGSDGLTAALLLTESLPVPPKVVFTGRTEAESIKLFANSYLASRVAYFNELDSFCLEQGLDARAVVSGVCSDPRIGDHYCNPSFGYGGYCLPKDTKQLEANFKGVPCALVPAIVKSNTVRAELIAKDVMRNQPSRIGVYSLAMKAGSDNDRSSSIVNVLNFIREEHPSVEFVYYDGNDLDAFAEKVDVILANRMESALGSVRHKVYTRDLFGTD